MPKSHVVAERHLWARRRVLNSHDRPNRFPIGVSAHTPFLRETAHKGKTSSAYCLCRNSAPAPPRGTHGRGSRGHLVMDFHPHTAPPRLCYHRKPQRCSSMHDGVSHELACDQGYCARSAAHRAEELLDGDPSCQSARWERRERDVQSFPAFFNTSLVCRHTRAHQLPALVVEDRRALLAGCLPMTSGHETERPR
jgi:hypothetical protein